MSLIQYVGPSLGRGDRRVTPTTERVPVGVRVHHGGLDFRVRSGGRDLSEGSGLTGRFGGE